MPIQDRQLSKTLAHVLRHETWLYELKLDAEGWTAVQLSSIFRPSLPINKGFSFTRVTSVFG